MKKGKKAGIVSCSNGIKEQKRPQVEQLLTVLEGLGIEPVCSEYLFAGKNDVRSGTARERASALMAFYEDEEIGDIFDISGGDVAVEVLSYLDFERIASSSARFWGYSDLTTVLNAIYAKTGKASYLYQIRNLVREQGDSQQRRFRDYSQGGSHQDGCELFSFSCRFLRGERMQGTVAGGNLRCLLKLAGTEYWPDMTGKILFLEGFSGDVPQLVSHLNQLKLMGILEQVQGILLGTFTEMEEKNRRPSAAELVLELTEDVKVPGMAATPLPVAVTSEIGHGADSKCLRIGGKLTLRNGG